MKRFLGRSILAGLVMGLLFSIFPGTPAYATTSWKLPVDSSGSLSGAAGETTILIGMTVCIKSDGKVYMADADDPTLRDVVGFVQQTTGVADDDVYILKNGILKGQTSLTPGGTVYLSTTAGGFTQDNSVSTAGTHPIELGKAISTTSYMLDANPKIPQIDTWRIATGYQISDEFATGSAWETSLDSYTITTQGTYTQALQDANGGTLLITNGAVDDDLVSIQTKKEIVNLTANKHTVFEARFTLNHATENDVLLGLIIRDITPLANSDGVYFVKADDQTAWKFICVMDSTITSVASVDTADTSAHTFSIDCDGTTSCTPYIDGVAGTAITTNLPTDEVLAPTFHIQNGEAVAKTLLLDFWKVSQER